MEISLNHMKSAKIWKALLVAGTVLDCERLSHTRILKPIMNMRVNSEPCITNGPFKIRKGSGCDTTNAWQPAVKRAISLSESR